MKITPKAALVIVGLLCLVTGNILLAVTTGFLFVVSKD